MRKTITVLLSAAALAIPALNGAAAVTHAGVKATAKKKVVTKKVTGSSVQADRWGTVTVNVTVKTTAGKRKYIDLGGSYTYHTDRSQYIMSQSLPILRQEFLQAQSPNVQIVSGATYTSQAFQQSLQSALAKV
jgi:uncharacterized protein with FMN-binding domain